MAAKSTKSKTTGKKDECDSKKSRLRIKKQTRKTNRKKANQGKEKTCRTGKSTGNGK